MSKLTVWSQHSKNVASQDLDRVAIWNIHGEDPNPDLGGYHSEPYIGTFVGSLTDAIYVANRTDGWRQWGSGGSIREAKILK